MIYRVHDYADDESQGYEYFGNLREARRRFSELKRIAKEEEADPDRYPELESAPTPRTKAEVLKLLGQWAEHANNG